MLRLSNLASEDCTSQSHQTKPCQTRLQTDVVSHVDLILKFG